MKWIIKIAAIVIFINALTGHDQAAYGSNPVDNEQVVSAIMQSDDFSKYKAAFVSATQNLVQEGKCTLSELRDMGGWVKSQNHKNEPVYFTYCGGMHISNRIYLNTNTGKAYR